MTPPPTIKLKLIDAPEGVEVYMLLDGSLSLFVPDNVRFPFPVVFRNDASELEEAWFTDGGGVS